MRRQGRFGGLAGETLTAQGKLWEGQRWPKESLPPTNVG